MPVNDLEAKIRETVERRLQSAVRKLEELELDEDFQTAREEVSQQLQQVQTELDALHEVGGIGTAADERLEARRERLLATQERLELRAEMLHERRARLVESIEEMRAQLTESLDAIGSRAPFVTKTTTASYATAPESQAASGPSRKMLDERRKILEMVEKGTISAQQAGQLLDALRDQEENERRSRRKPRWVRIRVTDSHDVVRVNLTLPVGLVRAGLRAGGSIAGVEGLDTAGLEQMLDRGELGHILDVHDSDKAERVEVFVE